jgi:hypothetical protein
MHPTLSLLLSNLYDGALAPEHRADLERSGLTPETIAQQKILSVPPDLIDPLLGFKTPNVTSAYLIPFPSPRGGWMDFIRMKIFPPCKTKDGTTKYLQPKHSGVRIFFPLATSDAVLHSAEPLYVIEGEKKSLAVAQTGLPSIGISGIEGWHLGGARTLHPDLDDVGLTKRVLYLVPDADHKTNPHVARAVQGLAEACAARGAASVRIVLVPPTATASTTTWCSRERPRRGASVREGRDPDDARRGARRLPEVARPRL